MAKSTEGSDKWPGVFSALTKVLPASLIQDVLEEFGKTGRGARKLPPGLVVWLVVGMGLFRDLNVSDVLARVVEGLGMQWRRRRRPHTTSISQARDRLGWLSVREIFRRLARLLRDTYVDVTKWRGLAVYALDGTTFLAPDTPANVRWFGLPVTKSGFAPSAFPRVRGLFLVGVWSHLIVDAVLGPYHVSELAQAEYMLDRLERDTLVLLDRAYYSFRWAGIFLLRRVHFVMRARQGGASATLHKTRVLGRGDWLCLMKRPFDRRGNWALPEWIEVRSLVCERKGFRPVLLITDLTDPTTYPAAEIRKLFCDRWEIELSFRELKVYMTQGRRVLRSKKPDRVLQEIYGLLIAFNCVRGLMCAAATEVGWRPDRLSFVECLNRVRWTLLGARDCVAPATILRRLLDALRQCRLPPRRVGRTYPRAVKQAHPTRFPRKRTDVPIQPSQRQYAAMKRRYVQVGQEF